ncbi:hypothetical protein C5P17_16490 [Escherichia coli]|nr:hypothetical protein C5P17_16490 [Escherichia coli]PPX47648.1 hypothetical protein C5P13_15725 [Escherichia coli]
MDTNNASAQQSNSIITTQSEDAKNSFESNKFNNMKKMYFALKIGNDSNLLIVFYVQIMPDDLVMQLHRF